MPHILGCSPPELLHHPVRLHTHPARGPPFVDGMHRSLATISHAGTAEQPGVIGTRDQSGRWDRMSVHNGGLRIPSPPRSVKCLSGFPVNICSVCTSDHRTAGPPRFKTS
jgi:hypothetical protein